MANNGVNNDQIWLDQNKQTPGAINIQNNTVCPNTFECLCQNTECERYRICCACVKHHREAGNLPCCLRPNEAKGETCC